MLALVLVLVVFQIGISGRAAAQADERAAPLFDEGVLRLKEGRFEVACALLEESYGLERKLGTLMALADCLDRWRRVHSATLRYEEYLARVATLSDEERARRAPQIAFAEKARVRLAPSVPRLRLVAPAAPGVELHVLLDGRPVAMDAAEPRVAVDPGRHVIEVQAPQHETWRFEADVEPSVQLDIELRVGAASSEAAPIPAAPIPAAPIAPAPIAPASPRLASIPPVSTPPRAAPLPPASSPKERARAAVPRDSVEPDTWGWRSVGWGLGGLGVAGVGVYAGAGLMVLRACPNLTCESRGERAKTLALVADVGLGVGLASLVASALVLLNTEPPARASSDVAWRPLAGTRAGGGWLGMSRNW